MAAKITACLNCTDRVTGCHSSCKKYLAQKTILDLQSKRLRQVKEEDKDIRGYLSSERGLIGKRKKK